MFRQDNDPKTTESMLASPVMWVDNKSAVSETEQGELELSTPWNTDLNQFPEIVIQLNMRSVIHRKARFLSICQFKQLPLC